MKGRITTVKRSKSSARPQRGDGTGFGFIRDEEGQDRFFHANGVDGTTFDQLQEGQAVEFEPYEESVHPRTGEALPPGKRLLRARKVRVLGS